MASVASASSTAAAAGVDASASAASSASPASLSLARPADDLHVHLRDGDGALEDLLRAMLTRPTGDSKNSGIPAPVARALVMPNLQPPVTTGKLAEEYRQRILAALARVNARRAAEAPDGASVEPLHFTPLMSLYLTDATTPQDIIEAKVHGVVACKLYPQGATTHSSAGVTNVLALLPTFHAMAEAGLLLLVHGESTDPAVDIFDREAAFLPTLAAVIEAAPNLRIVLEHMTTARGVQFVAEHARRGARVAATLTAHHLLLSRNALFAGGLNPALYCLPILKRESDRQALLDAVLSTTGEGEGCYLFAGTDSAPHPHANKEKACGCAAGCFTAHATIELYAEAFEAAAAERGIPAPVWQRRLERFLCEDGARFYGMPLNEPRAVVLDKQPWQVPASMPFGDATVVPLRAGQSIGWRIRP